MASRNDWIRWPALVGRLVLAGCWLVEPALMVSASDEVPVAGSIEAAERIDALRAEIARHDELYFKQAAPVISDADYDQLKQGLIALERDHPDLARGEAAVGDDRSGRFPVFLHRQRMLSLNKSYTEAELRAFDARLRRALGERELEYVVEPKYDGVAISVTYEKGRLVRGVTRGDGEEGDDVTANVRTIRGLPRALRVLSPGGGANAIPEVIELRGEIFIGFAEFARINRERESAAETPFASPRNLAAGTLKRLDGVDAAPRCLEIVFYGLGACEPRAARPDSQLALLRQLRAWGVPTIENFQLLQGADALWQTVTDMGRERARFSFPTDGAVVKLNSGALQDRLGASNQAPLWAIAHKFAPDRAQTRLQAITLQVGRTGVLTPVAELAPIQLGGVTVSRASLHNRGEIARRDIRMGDYVYVEKAGEIIPAVTGVNFSRRVEGSEPYAFPATCPACQAPLVQLPAAAAVRCPNATCPAQVRRRVEHFASDACVNIAGLGPALIGKLVDKGWVGSVADLYRLRREDLLTLGTSVGKSTDRLIAAIEKSKRAELWRFIHGLGIPQVGEVAARDLARRFGGLAALARAERTDFKPVGGPETSRMGEAAMTAILTYFAQPENRAVVAALLELGVRPVAPEIETGRPLAGKVLVLTGALPTLTRGQAATRIAAAGGTVAAGVSRRTDYVVAGEGSGAKLAAARSLGVAVIDEAELLRLLGED